MQTYFAFRFSPLQFCPKQGVSSFWNFLFFHGLFTVASLSSNEFLEIVDGTILGEEMGDASRFEALLSAFFVRDSRQNHGRAAEFGHRCCIKHFLN